MTAFAWPRIRAGRIIVCHCNRAAYAMVEHYASCHAVLSKFHKEWRESLLFDMLRADRHSAAFTARGASVILARQAKP